MKNPPLDFKKLDFSRPNIAPWLSLPKDLWSLILKDFETWRKMRVVCKYFAKLIDPIFCMRIILNDGHVMNCTKLNEFVWTKKGYWLSYSCQKCRELYNKGFKESFNVDFLKREWKWKESQSSHFFNIEKRKQKEDYNWFRFTILKSEPKISQVQKYFEITQPYNKAKVRTKDEYDPSRKSNHKKKKFRKVDRRLNFIEMEYNQI